MGKGEVLDDIHMIRNLGGRREGIKHASTRQGNGTRLLPRREVKRE